MCCDVAGVGAITVGCSQVGCEQLIFGSCCEAPTIRCDVAMVAPQVALVDSFAAVAFRAMQALCLILQEFDPCTANLSLRQWGKRFGLVSDDPCAVPWSDDVLRTLLCELIKMRQQVMNWDTLTALAARFGADINIHVAGDFSDCGPAGWWTMARDVTECDRPPTCPEGITPDPKAGPWIRLTPTCVTFPDSFNLVLSPGDIRIPGNCNVPGAILPHEPCLPDHP